MSSIIRTLCVLCVLCTLLSHVSGHAYLSYPVARTGTEPDGVYKFDFSLRWGDGNRLYPQYRSGCRPTVAAAPANIGYSTTDQGPATGPFSNLTVGVPVDLTWVITLPHPSAPGVQLAVDYNGGTNFQIIRSGVDVNLKKITWTPTQASPHAVIQWIWESTSDGGAYLGCADVRIAAASVTPGSSSSTSSTPSTSSSSTSSSTPSSSSTGSSTPSSTPPSSTGSSAPTSPSATSASSSFTGRTSSSTAPFGSAETATVSIWTCFIMLVCVMICHV